MAMMMLGPFPFELDTIAYDSLQHSLDYHWAEQDRLGHSAAKRLGIGGPGLQYLGPGRELLELNAIIYPSFKNKFSSTLTLRTMANAGLPWPLLDRKGLILGEFIIMSISNTQHYFNKDGSPRKVEFKMSLQRYVEKELLPFRLFD